MLLVSKVLSQLLLPPGGLIILLSLGFLCFKRMLGKIMVCLALILFWGLSTEPIRDMLVKPLEFQYPVFHAQVWNKERTAIVVLGGGVYDNAPDYAGQDYLHSYAMMRALYAAKLVKQTGLDVYATGGKPLNAQQDAEGDVMRKFLLGQGLDAAHVFAENFANNTWENASLMQPMLKSKGISTVILVTSAWHMPRSVACFQGQGLKVIAAPTDYLTKMNAYDIRSYLPSAHAFYDSNLALHEYLGLSFYRLRYDIL